jgi:serine/threonine protein kinase
VTKGLPERPPVLAGFSSVRLLGRGGFADVFLFQQDMPRRFVAVKVLHHDVVDAEVLRMFNAEADVMARLSAHPSILTVYAASISADGRPYLVMELAPGSMGNRFRTEQIPLAEVLTAGVKIASALETAVRANVLHRDIKPSNILITTFGTPVLADFGIAASLAGARRDDVVAMSVPWSAPEIVDESSSGTVASEVWALGATLYSLLAGRTPFEVAGSGQNSREQLLPRIQRAKYTSIGRLDVPERLELVLARTMERDPARRHASMLELANDLQHVQFELGMMPTALEIGADGWEAATGPGALDLEDTSARGPVVSTVPVDSRRPARVRTRLAVSGDAFLTAAAEPRRRFRVGVLVGIVAAVVVLGVIAVITAVVIGAAG